MKKILLLAAVLLLLSGCVAHSHYVGNCLQDSYRWGFWGGLWHGFISPVTFIVSLFDKDVTIYAVNNTGRWYAFGFVLGITIIIRSESGDNE